MRGALRDVHGRLDDNHGYELVGLEAIVKTTHTTWISNILGGWLKLAKRIDVEPPATSFQL